MNITFLFGNGFDLGMGMPTRFADFYEVYCKDDASDNENVRSFKKELKNWLCEPDKRKRVEDWADFEKTFGEYSTKFSVDQKQDYLECFEDFVSKFNLYLENVEKCTDFSGVNDLDAVLSKAVRDYRKIRKADRDEIEQFYRKFNAERIYSFITFNYTRTVDRCFDALKDVLKNESYRRVGRLVHIHGYIEDSMIVGVNDASQIMNSEFASDPVVRETLIKPFQNTLSRTGNEMDMQDVIDKSNIICIYGMSLGDTDKKWWDYLSKWLASSDNHILIILQHHEKYSSRLPHVQNKYIKPTLEKFLSFSSLPVNEKEKISSKIYIGFNNDVFAVKAFDSVKFEQEYLSVDEKEKQVAEAV